MLVTLPFSLLVPHGILLCYSSWDLRKFSVGKTQESVGLSVRMQPPGSHSQARSHCASNNISKLLQLLFMYSETDHVSVYSPVSPYFGVVGLFYDLILWWFQEKSLIFQFAKLYLLVRMGVMISRLFTCQRLNWKSLTFYVLCLKYWSNLCAECWASMIHFMKKLYSHH